MAKNIKEIGKELMGKSLNSFHRKTGLESLEKNNKMQDGILDGILSQVDDAYIEKTEQSNILHLEGSGDGVVVVDSIDGNTVVNLLGEHTYIGNATYANNTLKINQTDTKKASLRWGNAIVETGKTYTACFNVTKNTMQNSNGDNVGKLNIVSYNGGNFHVPKQFTGTVKRVLKQPSTSTHDGKPYFETFNDCLGELEIKDFILLEGDWTNREIPQYFEGMKSSFEEKVNNEGKHEIEVLSNNKNLFNMNSLLCKDLNAYTTTKKEGNAIKMKNIQNGGYGAKLLKIFLKKGRYSLSANIVDTKGVSRGFRILADGNYGHIKKDLTFDINQDQEVTLYYYLGVPCKTEVETVLTDIQLEFGNKTQYTHYKSNKIKLLLNEPLRAVGDIKDRLIVKDGKLMVERNCGEVVLDGSENWLLYFNLNNTMCFVIPRPNNSIEGSTKTKCDKFVYNGTQVDLEHYYFGNSNVNIYISKSKLSTQSIEGFKTWLQSNSTTIIYQLQEPTYEEVTNEYGVPVTLEGYENGTLYIDSNIIPTTSVRYTPKMESFNTLKEVNNNNVMLTGDINENIIPYMMDVDMMIMEKEMAMYSKKNKLRKIGEKDMTSMQKRTQQMLERLIKGKTLTEEECKTRVTIYLSANKITDAQAEELMLLISEVYA